MTRQKTFKTKVRSRMRKTGESYTAARRQLLDPPEPEQAPRLEPAPMTKTSGAALEQATGRDWDAWFALLDAWGGSGQSHTRIARWLVEEHSVPGWWAQTVTVGYEQARGLRVPGQASDGRFRANASKTVNVPVERLFEAFTDPGPRSDWLAGDFSLRTSTSPKSLRADWLDGRTRLYVNFLPKGEHKSAAYLEHDRLRDADEVAESKAFWRHHLAALKKHLET